MKTFNIKPIADKNGSVDFHVWQEGDGWYSCWSGEYRGRHFKSENIGPVESKWDAFNDQMDEYIEYTSQ